MPFVAKDRETGGRIDITTYRNPRTELVAERLACQLCEERMIIRQGLVVRAHFAHTKSCTCPYAAHPESPEHLAGKASVSAWLHQQPDLKGTTIALEVPIHARKRIADIMVTFPQGHRLAVEIQLAAITPAQLEARTKDYLDDGIDVIWVLGKDAARGQGNVQWCNTTLGGYLQLGFTQDQQHHDFGAIGTVPPAVRDARLSTPAW